MRLIDLEQRIFVPVVDETRGGMTYEMEMSVGEFLDRCCGGFRPEVVEAIPVEWLEQMQKKTTLRRTSDSIMDVLSLWGRSGKKEDNGHENL